MAVPRKTCGTGDCNLLGYTSTRSTGFGPHPQSGRRGTMANYTRTGVPAGPLGGLTRLAGPTHTLLRIGAGLLFMQHGAQKLFGALGGMDGNGAKAELM